MRGSQYKDVQAAFFYKNSSITYQINYYLHFCLILFTCLYIVVIMDKVVKSLYNQDYLLTVRQTTVR